MSGVIYKILPRSVWELAKQDGVFSGHGIDLDDGFIHLSDVSQVGGTLERYFMGHDDLLLLEVLTQPLGASLRWEASRNGEKFPHVYGDIPIEAIVTVHQLPLDDQGHHRLPGGLNRVDKGHGN